MFHMKIINMEKSIIKNYYSNRLILLGVLLFFLGLVVGLFVPLFANPRMGLSSHIEGVLNGIFLMVLGLIWHKIDLSDRWLSITFWLALYGTFANWFSMLFAAVFNAGKSLTIAANGQEGSPFAEVTLMFFLVSLSLAMLTICVTVMTGLIRNMRQES